MEIQHNFFVAVEAGAIKCHLLSVSPPTAPIVTLWEPMSVCAGTFASVARPTQHQPPQSDGPSVADSPDSDALAEVASANALLRGLNDAQVQAVTAQASPLRILAGAGSGKTRVLTHRIAYGSHTGSIDSNRVLTVTFTRKAAGELRTRLGRLGLRDGVQAGTFHAIAFAQLRQRWEERGIRPPELLDRKVGFVARLMSTRDRTAPLDVVSEIEWAAARRVSADEYVTAAEQNHRRPPIPTADVAAVYERYMEEKRRRRLVDFDDLLRLATRDLASDPVYAAARHWRFRHLFVDEFQDVNPLQFELLRAWMGPASDLCVVGDPNQAIYAWNGADARYLTDFDSYFPGGASVTLEDNYRSTPQILAAANAVLADGPSVPIRLRPHRGAGLLPTVTQHPDESTEASAIARSVRDHHRPGTPWAEQSILVRTNAQATVMAEALTSAKIPHRVRGAGDLLDQPEIKDAIGTLRRSIGLPEGLADLDASIRSHLPQTLDATEVDPSAPDPEQDQESPFEPGGVSTAKSPSRPAVTLDSLTTEERAANIGELVRLGRDYLSLDPTGGVPGFLAWITSALRGEDRRGGDAVEIVTFHAAKGLEWPVVHLAGLEEGFVPIHHANEADDIDEERRLLYVALTRARDELHCSWAARRTFGTRTMQRKPSPWLNVLSQAVGAAPQAVDRPTSTRRAAEARAANKGRPATPKVANQPLADAVREWRKQKAKAAGVPAYVIFNDATLHELVATQPTSRAVLLDVSGFGPVKVERFGEELLALVAEHSSSSAGTRSPTGRSSGGGTVTRLDRGPRSDRPKAP